MQPEDRSRRARAGPPAGPADGPGADGGGSPGLYVLDKAGLLPISLELADEYTLSRDARCAFAATADPRRADEPGARSHRCTI